MSEGLTIGEERAVILSWLSWPERPPEAAASYKRPIGRATGREDPTIYPLPNCPLPLLRDADAFEEFYRDHLTEARTRIREPWAFHIQVVIPDGVQRKLYPSQWPHEKWGSIPADQITSLHERVRSSVDQMWLGMQAFYCASVRIVEETGMTLPAIGELYKWLWCTKDGPEMTLEVQDRLRTDYAQLARSMLQRGDEEMAAQYGRVAFDLSPSEEIAAEVLREFEQLSARWDELTDEKDNVVKRVAAVAREGIAEWRSFVMQTRFVHEGLISPITDEVKEFYSSGQPEAHLQNIRRKSSTNPYRRGLELMKTIEAGLGLWPAMMAEYLTEFPLERLRLRVPASSFKQMEIRRGSPWAPDTRLEKLAELASSLKGPFPFRPEVMPHLYTIRIHLDDTLPGIMTYAFKQLGWLLEVEL